MMKSIVVFYDDENSLYSNEKAFDSKSAKDLSNEWALSLNAKEIVSIGFQENVCLLLEKMYEAGKNNEADYIIFAYSDMPFYNTDLTKQMILNHEKYHAEYTFCDGYSNGIAPQIIDLGTLNILLSLCKKDENDSVKSVSKDFLFELIKKDINSYEIETVLAKNDWRLLRLNFDCEYKENFLSCKALYEECKKQSVDIHNCDADKINEIASKTPQVLKTVPGFYNIQIADYFSKKCTYCPYAGEYEKKNGKSCSEAKNVMKKEDFAKLVKQIAEFSENAVISLSLWGEAFSHPQIIDFIKEVLLYPGLSVFIETQTQNVPSSFVEELKSLVKSAGTKKRWPAVMIAVCLDAVNQDTFEKIHGNDSSLADMIKTVEALEEAVPGNVYPQFVRMNDNEEELEPFFRYWNQKDSPAKGQFIIQKYDDYAGLLPEEKPADLSPIQRNVCWHLRRDMNILTNGDVILCKEYVLDNVIGNVFKERLEDLWNKTDSLLLDHMNEKYENKCEKCDEFYTYFF